MSTAVPHSRAETGMTFDYTSLHDAAELETLATYPVTDQALRKSCDRCYTQKLRCSKNGSSSNGCIRCENAGLRCIYSSRRPRRAKKRPRSWDDESDKESIKTKRRYTPRSVGLHILPSSSNPEVRGLLDPLSMAFFDLGDQGLADATYSGHIHSQYSWPPKDWPGEPEANTTFGTVATAEQSTVAPLQDRRGQGRTGEEMTYNGKAMMASGTSLDELASLLRRLEDYYHIMSSTEVSDDLQSYPIGKTLDGSRLLLSILRRDTSLRVLQGYDSSPPSFTKDQATSSSHTTNLLVALQCYILCVKIVAQFCQIILAHPAMIGENEALGVYSGHSFVLDQKADQTPPTSKESLKFLVDEAIAIPLHSDLFLGQAHSHLDPFGHLINCACDALGTGCKYLTAIEAILGIPTTLGVLHDNRPTEAACETDISVPAGVRSTMVQSAMPMPSMRRGVGPRPRHVHIQAKENGGDGQLLLTRLLTVLWDEETRFDASSIAQETALEVVRRSRKQIYAMARQRMAYSRN